MMNFGNKISILLLPYLMVFASLADAQDSSSARLFYAENDLPGAFKSINHYCDQKGNEEAGAWLLKARILTAISSNSRLTGFLTDGYKQAFDALKKAVQLDKQLIVDSFHLNNTILWQLYNGIMDLGVTSFNAGMENRNNENYLEALQQFKYANSMAGYFYEQGWGGSRLDTNSLYKGALAAIHAEKDMDALLFCRRIADAGMVEDHLGKGYEPVYDWLSYYYKKAKDSLLFFHYTEIGTRFYPLSSYFERMKIDWYRTENNIPACFPIYRSILFKEPENMAFLQAYLADINSFCTNASYPAEAFKQLTKEFEMRVNQLMHIIPGPGMIFLTAGRFLYNQSLITLPGTKRNALQAKAIFFLNYVLQKKTDANKDIILQAKELKTKIHLGR